MKTKVEPKKVFLKNGKQIWRTLEDKGWKHYTDFCREHGLNYGAFKHEILGVRYLRLNTTFALRQHVTKIQTQGTRVVR